MNKSDLLSFLSQLRLHGSKLGLERINDFLELLNNPQENFKTIHVAGTNGKGSTVYMISQILKEAGYKTGSYYSPHLSDFNERIRIDNKKIPYKTLTKNAKNLIDIRDSHNKKLTYFEFVTALALESFRRENVDFAVLETGLGGRYDATNIIHPIVSVITNIDFDHQKYLGNSLLKIAREKAGIIKENSTLITGVEDNNIYNSFEKICKEKHTKFYRINKNFQYNKRGYNLKQQLFDFHFHNIECKDLSLSLLGDHQLKNASLAVSCALILDRKDINEQSIRKGLANSRFEGRFEVVNTNPVIIHDVAHNPHGIKAITKTIKQYIPDKKIILVIGVSNDKEINKMAPIIEPTTKAIICTQAKWRGMNTEKVKKAFQRKCTVIKNVSDAVKTALKKAQSDDIILVTGSCFVVGEAKKNSNNYSNSHNNVHPRS